MKPGLRKAMLVFVWGILLIAGLLILGRGFAPGESAVDLIFPIELGVVGTMIVSRQPLNRVGWIFLGGLLLLGLSSLVDQVSLIYAGRSSGTSLGSQSVLAFAHALVHEVVGVSIWAILLTFAVLYFPNGELASPRWRHVTRLVAALLVLDFALGLFDPELRSNLFPDFRNPLGVPELGPLEVAVDGLLIPPLVLPPLSLILRFRPSRGMERQQIKWPMLSASLEIIAVAWVGVFAIVSGTPLLEILQDPWALPPVAQVGLALEALSVVTFPITIGIAILRYRLYDIDLIIRKTLQYTIVTGLLALVFVGAVIQLQLVLKSLNNPTSDLPLVLSTLAAVALFNPLRRRVQTSIDRRFYRSKYDARQTLADFSTAARDEVAIETLSQTLLGVVQETMRPERARLWLLAPGQREGP